MFYLFYQCRKSCICSRSIVRIRQVKIHITHCLKAKTNEFFKLHQLNLPKRLANNVDPDQTPRSAASDQGLHCLLRPVILST